MTWIKATVEQTRQRYHAIKCFTCEKVLPSRAWLKHHMGHEVHYVDAKGQIND